MSSRRWRIGVDCHSVNGMMQGIRTHVLELFSRVAALAPDLDFVFLAPDPGDLLAFSSAFRAPNSELVTMRGCSPMRRLLLELPLLVQRHRVDLLHTQYVVPPLASCRTAVTIHDLLFETHPELFPRFFRTRSKVLMRAAAARSELVCTVSDYSRRELARLYGVPERRLAVTPNAADGARFHPGSFGADAVRRRGLVPGSYLLTVGRIEPRKNQANVIRAYETLGERAPPLVLIGQRHFGYDEVEQLVRRPQLANRVFLFEDVGDAELPAWYRNALCFVYPSWAEGFGMPVMEAFASGVSVISSNTTALREIGEGAARLVSPSSVGELAAALREVAAEAELRRSMASAGLRRAEEYNWDRSARVLVESYRRLFAATPPR